MNFVKASSVLLLCVTGPTLSLAPNNCAAQDNTRLKEALSVITDTADKICQTTSLDYPREKSKLAGDAKAKLNGALSKLADLGISGSGSLESENSKGVLEKHIISAMQTGNMCKLDVFHTLNNELIAGQKKSSRETGKTPPPNVDSTNGKNPPPNADSTNGKTPPRNADSTNAGNKIDQCSGGSNNVAVIHGQRNTIQQCGTRNQATIY